MQLLPPAAGCKRVRRQQGLGAPGTGRQQRPPRFTCAIGESRARVPRAPLRSVPCICTPKHCSRHLQSFPNLGSGGGMQGWDSGFCPEPGWHRIRWGWCQRGGSGCLRWVQLEAGPWALGAHRPPARVSFPDGFPVFGCGARCRAAQGGVCRGGERVRRGVRVLSWAGGGRARCWPSPRGGARARAAHQWGAQVAARRKHPGRSASSESFPVGLADGVTCS